MLKPSKISNKYSDKKIVWFPEKLQSFIRGEITAPIYVRVKPLNRCNHKCFWCVYHEPEDSQMHKDMNAKDIIPIEKMREILKDFKEIGVQAVTYSGGGEPLMHPDIEEILEKTLEYGIALSTITNGQFLKGKVAELLTKAKWVRISIDYYDEESFVVSRRIHKKWFQPILDNINNFSKIKDPDCDLSVNFIITKENYKNIRKAAEMLKSSGVENIRFSPMWIDNFNEYHAPIKDWIINELHEIKKDLECQNFKVYSSYKNEVFRPDIKRRSYQKCYVMQYNPVVGADLNIYACHNQAYSSDSVIASIRDQSFKDAWFSQAAKDFHQGFNCQKICTGQCASDAKNIFIHELLDCHGDSYV
jgi:MoaA/NifB/PqqE/SkfB family radical SAM enzyme